MDKSEGHVCPLEQKQVRTGDNPGRGPLDGPCSAAAHAFWTGNGEGKASGPAAVDVVRRPGQRLGGDECSPMCFGLPSINDYHTQSSCEV